MRYTLNQRLDSSLASVSKTANDPVLNILVGIIEKFQQQRCAVLRPGFFEVAQSIIFERGVGLVQYGADGLDHIRAVQLESAQDQQRGAALLDAALFDQMEQLVKKIIHSLEC